MKIKLEKCDDSWYLTLTSCLLQILYLRSNK